MMDVLSTMSAPEIAYQVEAPAKLNFYLHVLGRRENGYHDLSSLVGFADVGDTLHVAPADGFQFQVTGPMAAPELEGDDNLCVRAAKDLAAMLGRDLNLKLTLVKRLPVASGIGGGSSDAAATLRLLLKFWNEDGTEKDIAALALSLGADVPVCLSGVPAEMLGIGEDVRPVAPLPKASVVLINPGICISTAAIFKEWQGPGPDVTPWEKSETAATFAASLMKRRNDLTPVAKKLVPVVGEVLSVLTARPECLLARMSGSGATCFGIFENHAVAEAAAEVLTVTHPHWWVRSARLLNGLPEIKTAPLEGPSLEK